jgi:hypothetical protein
LLARDTKRSVEACRGILPGDEHRELDQLVLVEVLSDLFEKIIVDISGGHCLGVVERGECPIIEQPPIEGSFHGDRIELFVAPPLCAADRSIEVLSKLTTDQRRDAAVQ